MGPNETGRCGEQSKRHRNVNKGIRHKELYVPQDFHTVKTGEKYIVK